MDSITQATFGGAIGEAILGKKIGYKAALWGAALGTVPDLDILLTPFLDSVGEIRMHRAFSHSIVFCLTASPLFGWLINRIHNQLDIGWWRWTMLSFWVFFTHILIDLPTIYGTQILFPFTNTPLSLDSIFIIDPLFTFPLLIGLITAQFFRKDSQLRRRINIAGLGLCSLYLIWGVGIKSHVHSVFKSSFTHQHLFFDKMKTTPNGPTTFLWTGYVIKNDTVYTAVYSIFDEQQELEFTPIPRQTGLIESNINDRAIKTLLWFSREYYTIQQENSELILYDLRFGRSDLWLSESDAQYVWANTLEFDRQGNIHTFRQSIPEFNTRTRNLKLFWNRIWGR